MQYLIECLIVSLNI